MIIAVIVAIALVAFVAGACLSGIAWERHHRAVLARTRADHRRQVDALLGRREAAGWPVIRWDHGTVHRERPFVLN